jgi:hypothetical protein
MARLRQEGMGASRIVARALVVAAGAWLLPHTSAEACENAVQLSASARIRTMQEAEAALDEGELERASELANEVVGRYGKAEPGWDTPEDRLTQRALRVLALTYVRDPRGHESVGQDVPAALVERRHAIPNPSSEADYAEALSRVPGGHEEAYAILEPLARKDLIGSPHALGALHRVATERGDVATARAAKARCEGMIGSGSVCRGDYPRPPLVGGTTRSYLPHALLALAALGYRLLRSRRLARGGVLSDGRSSRAPWVGHAAPLQAAALLGGAVYVVARATSPIWTATVFAMVILLSFAVERRAFFAAVRRGRVAGLVLRPSVPGDAHLPSLRLYRAPSGAHTLEHEHAGGAQPGYREAARVPLLRVERRRGPLKLTLALAVAVVVLLVVLVLLTAFAFLVRGV